MARRVNRGARSKTLTVAAANRKFARKKQDWVNVFSPICDGIEYILPEQDSCPNSFQIPLIDAAFIEARKEDSVLVKRLLGDLWFQLFLDTSGFPTTAERIAAYQQSTTLMRFGLKRLERAAGAPQELIFNPMLGEDIQTDPGGDDQGDFSEGRFIKEWQHLFYNKTLLSQASAGWYPVGDVNGGNGATVNAGTWAIAEGGINTSIETDITCVQCEGGGDVVGGVELNDTWHVHFDMKFRRGIRLRENQDLQLHGGWESLKVAGDPRPIQPELAIMGGLRLLIED